MDLQKMKRHQLLEVLLQYAEENEKLQQRIIGLEQELAEKAAFEIQVKELSQVTNQLQQLLTAEEKKGDERNGRWGFRAT